MESKRVFSLVQTFRFSLLWSKNTNCSRPYLRIAPCTTRKFYPTWASIWDEILFHLTRSIANSDVFHFSPSKLSLQKWFMLCFFRYFSPPNQTVENCTLLVLLVFFSSALLFVLVPFWGRKSRKLPRNIELSKKSLWALKPVPRLNPLPQLHLRLDSRWILWVSHRSSRGP